jgi:signal transduction histidine kinase
MKRGPIKIVPSRLMVVGLGTTLFVLCLAAIIMLIPGLIARERLTARLIGGLQARTALESEEADPDDLDRTLLAIMQSNKTNRNISFLRFVDLNDGSIFTLDEEGSRKIVDRADPKIWAALMSKGSAVKIENGSYEVFRAISPELSLAINLGIEPQVAHEIEAQRRLSGIVGSIILATGIGILIMIWQTRQIEEAKSELELVLANIVEPILMADNNLRLVFANEPARALLGHPKGKKFKNRLLLPSIQNPENREFFARLLSEQKPGVEELETAAAGFPDKVSYRAGVLEVRTELGRAFGKLIVLRDVTLEKRLEDKKTSQTIHELKAMLGEVKGFIRQALGSMEEESQREQRVFLNICLDKLEKCYNTVAVMVRSIVSAFKPQSLELRLRHSNLDKIVRSNVGDFESSLEKQHAENLSVSVNVPKRLPTVCCDPDAISRVLMNLLINALQHCPSGEIEVVAKEVDEMVQVSVRDNGLGIESQNLAKIFEPRESFRAGGSGLGLSICRDFIKAHEGEIWADSDGKEGGSVFRFTLPKSRPVILSSDSELAARLEAECRKNGYYPVFISDLLAATRLVSEIGPNAILLDLDMEDTISGLSLAYRLKKSSGTARIPIIAFTSKLSEVQSELDRYGEITLEAYLPRDFGAGDLVVAMTTIEAYWYLAQIA